MSAPSLAADRVIAAAKEVEKATVALAASNARLAAAFEAFKEALFSASAV